MFWLICNPNIFFSLSRPSRSPPPRWCVWAGVGWGLQGRCLTEPWMLFSCHTFPKRLAAAPIVAAEGGLLRWFFRPPAVALVSHGFTERECGPNNGRSHDIMPLVCGQDIRFRCMGQNKERCAQRYIWHASRSGSAQLPRGPLWMFFNLGFLVLRSLRIKLNLWNTWAYICFRA